MKTLYLNILLACSPALTFAQHFLFENSLSAAFEKAKQQNKPVFAEYYNSECPVCKKLEPVFSDPELAAFYNQHFINYRLNTENIKKEDSLFISNAGLKFESVPYFLFFDPDGNFIHYSSTKPDIGYLLNIGNTALSTNDRTAALPGKYQSGDRSIKTLYAYSNLLSLYQDDSLRNIIAEDLYNVFPKTDLGTEKSLTITKNCVNNIENGFLKYWIMHTDEAEAIEKNGKSSHPSNVLGDILQKSINGAERKNWSLDKIKAVKEMILKTKFSKDPEAFFWEQESRLLVNEKRDKDALAIFMNRLSNDSGNISAAVYTINFYLRLFTDPRSLGAVRSALERLPAKKATPGEKADLMYSNLLYYKRINDKKNLLRSGQEALVYDKANHIDPKGVNALLSDQ